VIMRPPEQNTGQGGGTPQVGSLHYEKCIDRVHKRYLSAIKALALTVLNPRTGGVATATPSPAPPLPDVAAQRLLM
jgi:hypothetical protein